MFAAAELSDNYKLGHAFLVGDTGTGVYSGDGKELALRPKTTLTGYITQG